MNIANRVLKYILIAALVVILGAIAGWYMFVHRAIDTTSAGDAGRGIGLTPSFGSPQGSTFANTIGATDTAIETGGSNARAPRLWHVAKTPAAGIGFVATSSNLYIVERASGNVLRADPGTSALVRMTNTLLPKIYDASFIDTVVYLRSIDTAENVTTYAGTIKVSTSSGEIGVIDGVYLPQNIIGLSARPKQQLFFLIASPSGGSIGITSDKKGGSQKRIFSSALADWRVDGTADGSLYLTQRAADDIAGYSFTLSDAGVLTPLISGVPGLVIVPRASSTALLWSSSQKGTLALFGRTAAGAAAVRLPIKTIAEKCTWGHGLSLVAYCAVPRSIGTEGFLTSWYSGEFHTSDTWWRVDVSAGTAEQIFSPDSSVTIDVVDPQIDQSGNYLAFRNAIDNTPWMLRIVE